MAYTEMNLRILDDEILDWRYKSIPPGVTIPLDKIGEQGWNAISGDLLLPVMVLKESALEHNLSVMASFCRNKGVSLAPHGKTTMAPQIFDRQLQAGAWAITAATAAQARIMRLFGVARIVLANQLVEPLALQWVADELDADSDFDFLCLVDSLEGVSLMERHVETSRPVRKLRVLVELGVPNGRTGCRSIDKAFTVANAVGKSPYLELAGVEGYEGILDSGSLDESIDAVDEFVLRLKQLTNALFHAGAFADLDEVIVTIGGSAFFDRILEHLNGEWSFDVPVRLVLRSGSYVTHDSMMYERLSPFASNGRGTEHFIPALELWGTVLSLPESNRGIVGFGKRDVSYDRDLPLPLTLRRSSGERVDVGGIMNVFKLNDQHAYVDVGSCDVSVGDALGCGISHPCTAFEKWAFIPVVDDDYRVIGGVRTFF